MASIKITIDKFPDIIISFMLDYIMNEDKMNIDNEKWDNFLESFSSKGLKPALIKYYIATDAVDKSKYKIIKDVFNNTKIEKKSTISILNNDEKGKNKNGKHSRRVITKAVKKIINIIDSKKKKHYGMPLHEETINGIIDNVLKEYYNDDMINEIKEVLNG